MASILEIALEYIGFGWAPIPVPYKSKRPADSEWQNLRITRATAAKFFNGEAKNIGVLLGDASGDLSDVDLDCAEAIAAAPAFLPHTRTFGRASKRFSHWLFNAGLGASENVATIKFQDVQKPAKIILEIRVGGAGKAAQTVFPGSMHPSGEPIVWDNNDIVSVIDGGELKRACAKLAACVLISRAYPQQGGRHEGAIVVAGFLCRCGFGVPDIKLFVDTVAAVTLQPPDKSRDMVRAAADAAAAFVAGRNTFGLPKMIEVFGEPVAKKCVEWLGYKAEARGANGERKIEASGGSEFVRGELGQILKGRPWNIRHAIDLLGVRLRKNEFSGQTEIEGLAGARQDLTDAGATRLRFLIEETYGFLATKELFEDVLIDIAHQNRFHPVLQYLNGLRWDGTPRIDTWLCDISGADRTPFNNAVGRIFLIAAVRRVRLPGCKFDTMLVFESPQGRNKSQAARILAMQEDWFNDNLPLGAKPQEVIEQIEGHWIIEFPELAGISSREIEHVKAFLSRQVDRARPAYGRRREVIPRQFVAIGTTNDDEYLKNDERRFWPVRIDKFDIGRLSREVNQLWAEAAHYEAEGEPIILQEDLWPDASEVRAERTFENPWIDPLKERIGKSSVVASKDVWEYAGIARENRQRYGKEVGRALRDLGFIRKKAGSDEKAHGIERGDWFYEKWVHMGTKK